jgi:hypothetical protein
MPATTGCARCRPLERVQNPSNDGGCRPNIKLIRYRTHAEHAGENQRSIRRVFAELAEQRPAAVHYGP